jgi:hypothetical protein
MKTSVMPWLLVPLVTVLGHLTGLSAGGVRRVQAAPPASERRAVIFYTGSITGVLEPCGCTSDPLGDVARLTGLVRRAAGGGKALLLDAGNLTYAASGIDERRAEGADLRAEFLANELGKLPFGGSALGEADLARGLERVTPRRLAANLTAPAGAPVLPEAPIREVAGIKIGVLGLSDPALGRRLGWKAEDPAAAAVREAARLRKAGAEIVIALGAFERSMARQVARTGAVDIIVVGQGVGAEGMARADQIEGTFIVAPADELQKVGRLELVLRGPSGGPRIKLVDAGGAEARALEVAEVAKKRGQLEAEIAAFARDPQADPAFVAGRRQELKELVQRQQALAQAFAPPAEGSYFINQLIPLRRALPRDPALATAMRRLDQKVGAANLKRALPPPPAPPDRASYVGDRACASCHKPAMAYWKTTVHAHAWKTIVDGGKTGFDDCVSCHVTGYGEVGGSSLGHVDRLTSVQCETCHGPGSLHVKAEGLDEPATVRRSTGESTCVRCHNQKHSDTFNFTAYLRDVLGPGHGAKARAALGPGPTGASLRAAAKARAQAAAKLAGPS